MQVDRALLERVGALGLAAPGLATGLRPGERRSPFLGRGMEFADYRPYHPGDDLRLVDWNTYERLGLVLVRLFHEDRDLVVRVALDASASLGLGDKSDHAATLAAVLALTGLSRRDRVTLAVVGEAAQQLTAHDTRGLGRMLALLESTQPAGVGDPAALTGTRRTDRTLLVSDLLLEQQPLERLLRGLASTSARGVVVHVLGQPELSPPLDEGLRAVDAETGEELQVRGGPSARQAYEEALSAWLSQVRERCSALGLDYVRTFTDQPIASLVPGALRQARVVEGRRGPR